MDDARVSVIFDPLDREVQVRVHTPLRDAAVRAGVPLDYPCGAQGTCGKCRVRFDPAPEPVGTERSVLSEADLADGIRLACQQCVTGDVRIHVPRESLVPAGYQILLSAGGRVEAAGEAPIRKLYVELPEPTLADDVADAARLRRVLGLIEVSLDGLRHLSPALRAAGFKGTAVLAGPRLIAFEPGDTADACFGVAFDLGTTTLVGNLYHIPSGERVAETGRMNPQIRFGDDVLSRITHAMADGGLHQLQSIVLTALNEMVQELADAANVLRTQIYTAVLAGNSTMEHLTAGIDPTPLGCVPFVPAFNHPLVLTPRDLPLDIHPRGEILLFPLIGGFVGGDTVAAIIATDIMHATHPTLLVDIGTNGEIALFHDGVLSAASCAAGPAFEGAGIIHGMRAAEGAIEAVRIGHDVDFDVIGGTRPLGFCGSALIDLLAQLLDVGVVTPEGKMRHPDNAEDLPQALQARLVLEAEDPAFVIAYAPETQTGKALLFHQHDVRQLQLAIAAIRSGIAIVLRQAGLAPESLDALYVAGAFGNYIRCESAQRIGLLPPGVPHERIRFVGNAALRGAAQATLSQQARLNALAVAQAARHVDLSTDPAFHEIFVDNLFFPPGS